MVIIKNHVFLIVLHCHFWSKESIWSFFLLAQITWLDVIHVFSFLLGKRSKYSPYGKDKYRWSHYTTILNTVTNNDTFPSWYTHVRASYGVRRDRDHLWRYRRSRFKKADGLCLRTRRFFQNTLAVAIVSGLAFYDRVGHTSPPSVTFQKPQNTCRCPLLLRIRFSLFSLLRFCFGFIFFQTHRLFYLTITCNLIIGNYKYCKIFAEYNR